MATLRYIGSGNFSAGGQQAVNQENLRQAPMNVINAVAQFERDLLIERTQSGLKRAKSEGKILGRPARLNEMRKQDVLEGLANGMSVSALARKFETSRQTIMRVRDDGSRSVRP